jgi:hypothetical protein
MRACGRWADLLPSSAERSTVVRARSLLAMSDRIAGPVVCFAVGLGACAPGAPPPSPAAAAPVAPPIVQEASDDAPTRGGIEPPESAPIVAPDDWNPHFTEYPRPIGLSVGPPRAACSGPSVDPWRNPPRIIARVSGSPADVHTPEGAAQGYVVYKHCTSGGAVAVCGNGTKAIPQFGPASPSFGEKPLDDLRAEFQTFARAAAQAAGVSSIDGVDPGPTCFGASPGYSVLLHMHDWRQVDQAIRNLGRWLARGNWNGEMILDLTPRVAEPVCPK